MPTPFAAAPCVAADTFNTGLMVVTPNKEVYADMVWKLDEIESYSGGDQGFLNVYFSTWYSMPVENRLSMGYNTPLMALDKSPEYIFHLEKQNKFHVVHCWGYFKPWSTEFELYTNDSSPYFTSFKKMYLQSLKSVRGMLTQTELPFHINI